MCDGNIYVIFEDMIVTIAFTITIISPTMCSLSCASVMNNERTDAMQNYQFWKLNKLNKYIQENKENINDKNLKLTINEQKNCLNKVKQARKMGKCAIDVLDESRY